MVWSLVGLEAAMPASVPRAVRVNELRAGQHLVEDLCAKSGLVLAPRGQLLSEFHIERIRQFAERGGVREPIQVQEPAA